MEERTKEQLEAMLAVVLSDGWRYIMEEAFHRVKELEEAALLTTPTWEHILMDRGEARTHQFYANIGLIIEQRLAAWEE